MDRTIPLYSARYTKSPHAGLFVYLAEREVR
jgi:hypothetical protein